MKRFVVFRRNTEWLVTSGERVEISFNSRKDAEASALAADALAANSHAVSVLILPDAPGPDTRHAAMMSGLISCAVQI